MAKFFNFLAEDFKFNKTPFWRMSHALASLEIKSSFKVDVHSAG